jgi:hypothetical protein
MRSAQHEGLVFVDQVHAHFPVCLSLYSLEQEMHSAVLSRVHRQRMVPLIYGLAVRERRWPFGERSLLFGGAHAIHQSRDSQDECRGNVRHSELRVPGVRRKHGPNRQRVQVPG